MNPQNVNVNTATPESPKTWVERLKINGLDPAVSERIDYLGYLSAGSMEENESAELLLGTLLSLADTLRDAVRDWSVPRPLLPLSLVQAWLAARNFVLAQFGETGQAAWNHARNYLQREIHAGYSMWREDIY
ncbi:hypothetical protein PMPD1_4422 (plasmid) [Paramixta manurensis]|uniref:Uncharacterized protein n=1 Tax=Paramixta manurensis TaxID=2740817 RepID=A0A6M8UNC7_9GAMM|nr:hypothetical protein PMPD1_4422 [Erwiniaceae bacterium PD-1]